MNPLHSAVILYGNLPSRHNVHESQRISAEKRPSKYTFSVLNGENSFSNWFAGNYYIIHVFEKQGLFCFPWHVISRRNHTLLPDENDAVGFHARTTNIFILNCPVHISEDPTILKNHFSPRSD